MLLALAIACSLSSGDAGPSGPPPALVEVAEVQGGSLADTWTYLGEVRPLERAELASGASGAVTAVSVREGARVAEGELLVEVDPALAAAQLAAARAEQARVAEQLAQARRTLERMGRVGGSVLAENELDAARSQVTSLEAALKGAEAAVQLAGAQLGRHRVRAPFPGVVARRHVDPGDWVSPGVPVLDLVSTSSVEVVVDAPAELALRIRTGDAAELRGSDVLKGEVVGVVPALDPVSRTSVVRVKPEGGGLVPGTAVQVAFAVQLDGGVVVPRDAVVPGPVEDRVVKVVEGQAQPLPVTQLASSAHEVLVRAEGLAAGDVVVVRGNERLRPGQPVKVGP